MKLALLVTFVVLSFLVPVRAAPSGDCAATVTPIDAGSAGDFYLVLVTTTDTTAVIFYEESNGVQDLQRGAPTNEFFTYAEVCVTDANVEPDTILYSSLEMPA